MNDTQITMPGFEPPTQEEALRAQHEALRRKWEELEAIRAEEDRQEERREIEAAKGADPAAVMADLLSAIDEILLMMERGSRPAVIAMIGDKARLLALKLESATGDSQAGELASILQALSEDLKVQDAREAQELTKGQERASVFTPAGKEYRLPEELEAYKKDNPTGAAVYAEEHPQQSQAEAIRAKIRDIAFMLDTARDPRGALRAEGIPPGYAERHEAAHLARLVNEAARRTGSPPAQIVNEDTRTEEQARVMAEIEAEEQIARAEAFTRSLYMQALNILEPDGESTEAGELAALYFFATHEDIDPTGTGKLTKKQGEELRIIYKRLSVFCADWSGPEGGALPAFIEAENPDPAAANLIIRKLPIIQGLRPKSHTMPNNKMMNMLQTAGLINGGETQLIVQKEDKTRHHKEITSYTMVSYTPRSSGITVKNANLSEYERQVSDAVISLWIEAEKEKAPPFFTVETIFKAMPGGSDKPSAQQKGAITKALDKFSRLRITVDATAEARQRGIIGDRGKYEFSEPYFAHRLHTVRVKNGASVQAYQILSRPVMLTYCMLTNQLLTVPAKYIAIEKVKGGKPSGELIAMTPTRQAMTGYLVRRIKQIQYGIEKAQEKKRSYDRKRIKNPELPDMPLDSFRAPGDNNVILFDTVFELVGIADQDRDRAMENRKFCFQVLDYQIAVGNISGYRKKTVGRSIIGIEIIP